MKKFIAALLICMFLIPLSLQAGTVNRDPYGRAMPRLYGYSNGVLGDYYLDFPALSGNDTFCGLAAAQVLTNKTISGGSNTLSAIENSSLTSGKSYNIVALTHDGQETATLDPVFTFQMPFAATLVEVSATARNIDPNSTDETYTIDVEEAGTTVLSSAISITADNTPAVGTISDAVIADNAKIEIVLTLGGTSPAIDDLTVLLTFKEEHTS